VRRGLKHRSAPRARSTPHFLPRPRAVRFSLAAGQQQICATAPHSLRPRFSPDSLNRALGTCPPRAWRSHRLPRIRVARILWSVLSPAVVRGPSHQDCVNDRAPIGANPQDLRGAASSRSHDYGLRTAAMERGKRHCGGSLKERRAGTDRITGLVPAPTAPPDCRVLKRCAGGACP